MAAVMAQKGHTVIGVDVNGAAVAAIQEGRPPVKEPYLAEMIAANRGLGYLVQFSGSQFDTAGVFAVLLVIALLAVALNFLVEIVQHRMQQWRVVGR